MVDNVVRAAMQTQDVPGMIVAVGEERDDVVPPGLWDVRCGNATSGEAGDVFEIGSVTKRFTAALIMKLQEQGRLHVDDSISFYLPEFKFPAAITLRMLLNHTSGLADTSAV